MNHLNIVAEGCFETLLNNRPLLKGITFAKMYDTLRQKTGSYTPEFDERYRTIAEEINALKEAQKTARNEKWMADSYEQRIQDIDHYLSTSTCQIQEFDNDLVRRMISTIKVESSEKLLIQFQSGIVMEQEIRYE
jgi:site-specific DNA recombinase